jgi:hypothetical protein
MTEKPHFDVAQISAGHILFIDVAIKPYSPVKISGGYLKPIDSVF